MGSPVSFQGANTKFIPGQTSHVDRGVADVFAFNNGLCNTTCWELDDKELAEILRTKRVWASQMGGAKFFPMFVGSENSVRSVLVDFGRPLPRQSAPTLEAPPMKLVIIESPFAGTVEANVMYARRAMADSLKRGEAPIASHLIYTQEGILDDTAPHERTLGIEAGLAWGRMANLTAVYVDRGVSRGMEMGIDRAQREGRSIEIRRIEQ